jgi:hypothetical protein
MRADEGDDAHVRFDQPLEVRVMTVDGTQCGVGRLIEISDHEAEIELKGEAAGLSEFFLMLTAFGKPVFRRCSRDSVRGAQISVSFKRTNIGMKSANEIPQEQWTAF